MLSPFTPVTSPEDIRLVTLIGITINVIESLAIQNDLDPEFILSKELYLTNKRIHEIGTNCYLEKLTSHYPLLKEAIN
jgi:hypothetical protein